MIKQPKQVIEERKVTEIKGTNPHVEETQATEDTDEVTDAEPKG